MFRCRVSVTEIKLILMSDVLIVGKLCFKYCCFEMENIIENLNGRYLGSQTD